MSMDTVLYAYTFRTRAERVLWTLRELNLDFEVIRFNPFAESGINPEFLKLNPEGKVPVLVHNDKVMRESLAIMEYLASISESKALVPPGRESNYKFRRKLHYGLTEIEPYLWLAEQAEGPVTAFYHWPAGVYAESIARVEKSCQAVGEFLDRGEYLVENGFTIADIYFYHILSWAKQHGIEHEPKVEQYLTRLEHREAFPEEMYWKQ